MTTDADRWDEAPCGLAVLDEDGVVLDVNRTLAEWVGRDPSDLVGRVRLSELLSVGGRIYWETHLAPILVVEERVDEVAVELRTPAGRMPVLLTAVARPGPRSGRRLHLSLSSARERSRYERELLAARRAADAAAAQTAALQQVTEALSRAVGVAGVAEALLGSVTTGLGAASATFWAMDPRLGLVLHSASGERVDLSVRPSALAAMHGGDAIMDDGRPLVPVVGRSGLHGVISIQPSTGPAAEPVPLDVLTAVGQQGGLALDRARLHEQNAQVAHELQRSLLSVEPPTDDRFELATAYRPGVATLDVGGDWHDAFIAHDEVLAFLVGDVVGRGLGAAAAMGQLRSAVRALAGPDVGPSALVTRLDRFVHRVEAAATATLAYGELDLATGRVRLTSAGHLPPLLIPADGPARLVWDGRSTPLGVVLPEPRQDALLRLERGDRILLISDGLIERRDRTLTDGLDLLCGAAARLRAEPPDELVAGLMTELLSDDPAGDDVCVLLLTWSGR